MAKRPLLIRNERGATLLEFAIIGAVLGIGLLASLFGVDVKLKSDFSRVGGLIARPNAHVIDILSKDPVVKEGVGTGASGPPEQKNR